MRVIITTIAAFFLSVLAGGIAAGMIAEATKAQEEFILVFFAIIVVALVACLLFGLAQLRAERAAAVSTTGRWLLGLIALMIVALVAFSIIAARNLADTTRDVPILVGFALPSVIVVAAQWIFVRWRLRRAAGT